MTERAEWLIWFRVMRLDKILNDKPGTANPAKYCL